MLDYFQEAGPNMLHFIRKLKSIHPDMIVSQPTYGYPQVLSFLAPSGAQGFTISACLSVVYKVLLRGGLNLHLYFLDLSQLSKFTLNLYWTDAA